MKILFFIALATIFASLPVHSQVIVNHDNGVINCDGFICPAGSTSCTASKKTFGDLSKYEYIRTCTNGRGVTTDSKTEVLNNPHPGIIMNSVSQLGGNNLSEAERRELHGQIDNIRANLRHKLRVAFRK